MQELAYEFWTDLLRLSEFHDNGMKCYQRRPFDDNDAQEHWQESKVNYTECLQAPHDGGTEKLMSLVKESCQLYEVVMVFVVVVFVAR